mmetsp:Transcript_27707/g.70637  ORF Transcript_27707/g.70637 Transcript_27707/m.70637 type:complete len:345 (+) Transcript_27707:425-1459(+)
MGLFGLSTAERVRWTDEEDALILEHASLNGGVHDWESIAAKLTKVAASKGQSGRTADAVRNHWHRLVKTRTAALKSEPGADHDEGIRAQRPRTDRQKWTEEEDAIILKGVEAVGKQWRAIAKLLPPRPDSGKQRSDSSIRNRWERLMKKESADSSSGLSSGALSPEHSDTENVPEEMPQMPPPVVFGLLAFPPVGMPSPMPRPVQALVVPPTPAPSRFPSWDVRREHHSREVANLARRDSFAELSTRSWRQGEEEAFDDIDQYFVGALRSAAPEPVAPLNAAGAGSVMPSAPASQSEASAPTHSEGEFAEFDLDELVKLTEELNGAAARSAPAYIFGPSAVACA